MIAQPIRLLTTAAAVTLLVLTMASSLVVGAPVDKWVTATGRAAGDDGKAKDEAIAQALRSAVEEACGVFLTTKSKTDDYKTVYDKVIANAVGYVREHKVDKVTVEQGVTTAKVRARVSTRKFEEDWASIAHTIHQANNPRVVVAIVESVHNASGKPTYEVKEGGKVETAVESFFLAKGISLMDSNTAAAAQKRDILLAAIKDDVDSVASLGARFKADVVVLGKAVAKFGKELKIADQTMYQYTASFNVRVVQTDSARILAVQSYGPFTVNTMQKGGGEDKALAKLADDCAPKLLAAVVEAWRKRANVSRTVELSIAGMDFARWKTFKAEVAKIRGVQAIRLREITQSVANIDIEYRYGNTTLAERLTELKETKLKVTEITSNRLRMKVE